MLMTVPAPVQKEMKKNLSEKLKRHYNAVPEYMSSNRLKLNGDKTHLMIMMTDKARKKRNTFHVNLNTGEHIVEPSDNEYMLGAYIHQNLKWTEHIQNNKHSLMNSLNKRLNALCKIAPISTFKTRKMIENGIFNSKLIYMMPVWGGCEKYLLNSLQKKSK